jgi:hypothetical protein
MNPSLPLLRQFPVVVIYLCLNKNNVKIHVHLDVNFMSNLKKKTKSIHVLISLININDPRFNVCEVLLPVLGQNSTDQSTSTTLRNPSLAHKHDSDGSPVI